MLRQARELATRLVYQRRLGARWAGPLSRNAIWPLPGATVSPAGALVIPCLGTDIPEPNRIGIEVLLSIRLAVDLHSRGEGTWTFEEDAAMLDVEGVHLRALNHADINMLHEIFVERLYAFSLPGPFLVLDVGANIGASALYFAQHYDADVQAFELVPSTAALARSNLALNPGVASRIELHEFGLGERDETIEIRCDPNFRPSNSIFAGASAGVVEKVSVKAATPIVAKAAEELNGRKLVLKLDAEGAEYGILRKLAEAGLMSKIDLLLLEWHRLPNEEPAELRSLLEGFTWFEREHPEAPVGFITAFRR